MHAFARAAFACVAVVSALGWPSVSDARKFDFKSESFASYLKGTYGPSAVGRSPFGDSSGASTTVFDQTISSNYSGEFGFLLSTTNFNLRGAVEMLIPSHISDVKGKDAGDNILFNLDTRTTAVIPMFYVDIIGLRTPTSKAFVGAGIGYGYVKVENRYELTAAGLATYPTLGDFTEKAEGQAVASHVYAGYETLLTDTTTVVFDLGYRYLNANSLTHLAAADTFNGSVVRGDRVTKANGTSRGIDLSGGYIGLAFRIYIGI